MNETSIYLGSLQVRYQFTSTFYIKLLPWAQPQSTASSSDKWKHSRKYQSTCPRPHSLWLTEPGSNVVYVSDTHSARPLCPPEIAPCPSTLTGCLPGNQWDELCLWDSGKGRMGVEWKQESCGIRTEASSPNWDNALQFLLHWIWENPGRNERG